MSARRRSAPRLEPKRRTQRGRARTAMARIRRRNAQRRLLRTAGAAVFGAAFGLGLAAAFLDFPLWSTLSDGSAPRLESISVLGHERLAASEIATTSGIEAGTAIAEVDLALAADRLRAHPWLRAVRLQRLAGELLVIVEERQPAAVLRTLPLELWRAVEADGTPFAIVEPASLPGLPRLHAEDGIATGSPEPLVAEALELTRRIEAHGIPRPDVVMLPSSKHAELGWRCLLPDGGPEVVLGHQPGNERLARLAKLLAAQPEAVRSAERIDMRFRDRAILRVARIDREPNRVRARRPATGARSAQWRLRPASG